jgi:hypothetical protein
MDIFVFNYTPSSVVLFSVDSISKQEKEEGVVPPGGPSRFSVPTGTELQIKDLNTKATILTAIANPPVPRGSTEGVRWEEQGNSAHSIGLSWRETVTWELSGSWTYRSFNPTYVAGAEKKELELVLAEAVFDLQTPTSTTLQGTIDWPGGGLDLNGTLLEGFEGAEKRVSFDIVGIGRPRTETADWEYRYHGQLTPPLSNAVDQRPTLVGSVLRSKPHGQSPAGAVYSFIAVKEPQPDGTFLAGLSGLWTYRSFHNWPRYIYQTTPQMVQPAAHQLILHDAVFKFETPNSTTLQGAIEWNVGHGQGLARGGGLDLSGTIRPGLGGDPSSFEIVGIGRPGTETAGWEYRYQGHLLRPWPNAVDELPALVGSVIRSKAHVQKAPDISRPVEQAAPAGYVAPFIAVKATQ